MSIAHAARGIVAVNGLQVRFTSIQVEQNAFSAADSFEIILPYFIRNQQNGEKVLANGPDFTSVLLTQDVVPVQVWLGYPSNPFKYTVNDLVQVMDGYMDTATFNFDNTGEFVTLDGRNMVGQLIDTLIVDKLPNLTSSAIANKFALEHGLTPVVTSTSTLAGTYYNQNSTITADNSMSEWDLLLFLAQQENFICRVKGRQLLFGPYGTVTGYVNQTPIPLTWGQNIEKLEFQRSPQAAKDIVVKVISYDRNNKNRITETAKSTTQYAQRILNQNGQRQQYTETYVIPGLTRDQAQKKAIAICAQLSRSQIIGQITCAGNTDMTIDRQIAIQGVGLILSDNYYLNKVTHELDINNGYNIDASFSNQFLTDGSTEVAV